RADELGVTRARHQPPGPKRKPMTIGTRVILISAASIGLATVVATVIQKQALGDQGIELTKNTMRATVLSAENVRQHIGQLHNEGAFDQAAMQKSAREATDK